MRNDKALLFDLNGTMIDDMYFHLDVWYDLVVNRLGANLTKEEVKNQMYGKNDDLIKRIFGDERFTQEELNKLVQDKEVQYQKIYRPHLTLLPGLLEFLANAKKHDISMAIGSAAPPFNIDFVLDNLNIRHYFKGVISASDVEKSKPHPDTFLRAAALTNIKPSNCIVFEDAPKGVEAALRANMKAVAVTTIHTETDFNELPNVIMFIKDYNDSRLAALIA